jgi:hypothetical protein
MRFHIFYFIVSLPTSVTPVIHIYNNLSIPIVFVPECALYSNFNLPYGS